MHSLKKYIGYILVILSLLIIVSCSKQTNNIADIFNQKSYDFHYKNLDSVIVYANKALKNATNNSQEAEALNNIAFVHIVKMDYDKAAQILNKILVTTNNQLELLVANIQLMRLCQRQSMNKDFYLYVEKANGILKRIEEEEFLLSNRQKMRLIYARTEYNIVFSTYYYYLGLYRKSSNYIHKIDPDGDIKYDIIQYLLYLYNLGSGGIVFEKDKEKTEQFEFDCLITCYLEAQKRGLISIEANALQAISEHLVNADIHKVLIKNNLQYIRLLNSYNMPDNLLPGNLALRSLNKFKTYGDVYQTAGAYRTLAKCYWLIGEDSTALTCLELALNHNTKISKAPDLIASIREQMSVVYSSMNNKPQSDFNRNIYLDIQDESRQDRFLEARAEQLDHSSTTLNIMIILIICGIIVIIILIGVYVLQAKYKSKDEDIDKLYIPIRKLEEESEHKIIQQAEICDDLNENVIQAKHLLEYNTIKNIEQKSKIELANNITPLIDRLINEIEKLMNNSKLNVSEDERLEYINELIDCIDQYNNTIVDWIQLRRGEISLRVESFAIQSLFDLVKRNSLSYKIKDINLIVEDSELVVKADKTLTLFMINTIADNAKRYTPKGGTIRISSKEVENYVEISIEDNGEGIEKNILEHIFDIKNKQIKDVKHSENHGFGLINCKGIIEKYKKISSTFNVCNIIAESEKHRGSKFTFTLPKGNGVRKVLMIIGFLFSLSPIFAKNNTNILLEKYKKIAEIYADSAYHSNINGDYRKTLYLEKIAIHNINNVYRLYNPNKKDTLRLSCLDTDNIPEIGWFHRNEKIDFKLILFIRNEIAVAALALHEWATYNYNNKIYTNLFKEMSIDPSLGSYVKIMQRSDTNKNVAIVFLVIIVIFIFPVYYMLYYRSRMRLKNCIDRINDVNNILLSNKTTSEKLTFVKKIPINKFPQQLRDVIIQIRRTLTVIQTQEQKQNFSLQEIKEDLRKVEIEKDKIYVVNNILDNCLTTLKHETMYYPARIKQLIKENSEYINALNIAKYYEELHSLFCLQALKQVEIIKNIEQEKLYVTYLLDILKKQNNHETPKTIVNKPKQSVCTQLILKMNNVFKSKEECKTLFNPYKKENIPYFICSQIIREISYKNSARECGIEAECNEKEGITIKIILYLQEEYEYYCQENKID